MNVLFWGRSTCDLTYKLKEYPTENEKYFSEEFLIQPGGPALNAAITFAFLNDKAGLLTRIGNSINGKYIKQILSEYKIELMDLSDSVDYDLPLSTILTNSKNGSRTIINTPNQNTYSSDQWVIKDIVRLNPELILIDGYEIDDSLEQLRILKRKGAKIILDGGSWKKNDLDYLYLVDIAICSERYRFPGMNLDETVKELSDRGIKQIAFTNGEKTITVFENEKISSIKVNAVNAVDTLGAGDVFHGAFCHYYLTSKDFVESLIKASKIAGKSCEYFGTHTWQNNEV